MKTTKLLIIAFLIFFLLISCRGEIKINEKMMLAISTYNEDTLPDEANSNVFVLCDNGKIFETRGDILNRIYLDNYKKDYKNFYIFLYFFLNQKIKINSKIAAKYEYNVFDLDKSIMELSYESIITKYFKTIDQEKYYFYPKSLADNQIQTILYKMFINNYIIFRDDYGGKYILKKYR